jgi:hypothetical protein
MELNPSVIKESYEPQNGKKPVKYEITLRTAKQKVDVV